MAKKAGKTKKAVKAKKAAKKATAKKTKKAGKRRVIDPFRGKRDGWPRP